MLGMRSPPNNSSPEVGVALERARGKASREDARGDNREGVAIIKLSRECFAGWGYVRD